jgi:RNA polymerase sigma-70 factor (ECF subfamily)
MLALVKRYIDCPHIAEEVLNDGYLRIFKCLPQYNYSGSFEGWMKRIVIHHAIDRYRTEIKTAMEESPAVWLTEETEIEDPEIFTMEDLIRMIQELPDQYRLVFSLYEMEHYSHAEIGTLLQISEGTSRSNLSRAKQILKSKIEQFSLHHKNHGT